MEARINGVFFTYLIGWVLLIVLIGLLWFIDQRRSPAAEAELGSSPSRRFFVSASLVAAAFFLLGMIGAIAGDGSAVEGPRLWLFVGMAASAPVLGLFGALALASIGQSLSGHMYWSEFYSYLGAYVTTVIDEFFG